MTMNFLDHIFQKVPCYEMHEKCFRFQKVDFPENSFSYVATRQVLTKISWTEVKIRERLFFH
uniref:Putative ovule protein n=1 Tax=Solanum chacoense TaxID=4108 RepID=A0A0V0HFQ6_SOLCH